MAQTDIAVAIAAAEAGAAIVRRRFGTAVTRMTKSPTDFATDVDISAEQAILDVLRGERPDDVYRGEESGRSGNETAGRSWLVDPLCGTLNFAARTPPFAVNVALFDGSRPTVAVAADPLTGEVFWTDGRTAYVRRGETDEPLRPSAVSRIVDVNLDPPFPNAGRFDATRLLASADFAAAFRPRVVSTTLALAWVATGQRAAYVTDGHLDGNLHFASGIALCQTAGCVVTGLLGQPLHTGVGGLVAAADAGTHATLIAIITALANG